jgi:hypothetical protein
MVAAIIQDALRPRQDAMGRSFPLSEDDPLTVLLLDELSSLVRDRRTDTGVSQGN